MIFERFVAKEGKDHWGILANEGQIDEMIRAALVRADHKGLKAAPDRQHELGQAST